jgi:hypothetical protein
LTMESKCADAAVKSSLKKKTLIGVAERISMTTMEKCGGAAAREAKTSLDASGQSTSLRKMKMMTMMNTTKSKISRNNSAWLGASAVKRWGT